MGYFIGRETTDLECRELAGGAGEPIATGPEEAGSGVRIVVLPLATFRTAPNPHKRPSSHEGDSSRPSGSEQEPESTRDHPSPVVDDDPDS